MTESLSHFTPAQRQAAIAIREIRMLRNARKERKDRESLQQILEAESQPTGQIGMEIKHLNGQIFNLERKHPAIKRS